MAELIPSLIIIYWVVVIYIVIEFTRDEECADMLRDYGAAAALLLLLLAFCWPFIWVDLVRQKIRDKSRKEK